MAIIEILLVSSQPSFRNLVRQALSQDTEIGTTGIIECDPGKDGKFSIAGIGIDLPDIVLLDIGYPFLNGLKLGKKISSTFSRIRVVILSSNPEDDDNELFEAARSGAAAYLRSKQLEYPELTKVIKRINNGECPISDEVINNPGVARLILRQLQDMASMTETVAFPLNSEETQVLQLIATGNQKQRIANILGVSEQTIIECATSILRKLTKSDISHDMSIKSRRDLLFLQIARNGNLLIFDAPSTSNQTSPLCGAIPRQ